MFDAVPPRDVTLRDKYAARDGRIYLSGVQALVRTLLVQRWRDQAAGLQTGGFVSGYRGSPLGGLDSALWEAEAELAEANVRFSPGLNEDLAATALWGTQQIHLAGDANVQGVFGLWYGKGPGVDRSLDVLKHANLAGVTAHGGVIAVAGDDHTSQSSTLAHQSEQTFIAAMIPVLSPAGVQEFLDFGVLGYALSRFSGCWVGLKAIAETVESSASVEADPWRVRIKPPTDLEFDASSLHLRWPDAPLEAEARLHGPKMAAVAAFARANRLDHTVVKPAGARLGIIASGKNFLDVRQALTDLGAWARADELGLALYKVGMPWPLEDVGVRSFVDGLQEVLVVEEKQGLIEDQLKRILFNIPASARPRVVGKRDERGAPLVPSSGELGSGDVAALIAQRIGSVCGVALTRSGPAVSEIRLPVEGLPARAPFFCGGCPHNTSTRLPQGSRAFAGIGCHGMAVNMPDRPTGPYTQMGGEGANWIGQAPFVTTPHIFQNLGDGTYSHSGLLAIRAAAAAGVNITYKILFNDAVAMTGGQPAEGSFTVDQITRQIAAEGVRRIAVVADDVARHLDQSKFASGATLHPREDLEKVQVELREIGGVSALIYDQTCATEMRRRRKRGLAPDPTRRLFINPEVCEGCGDCSKASNCVAIVPLETGKGRKRAVDQSACNKDFSCEAGFCPSFVVVEGGRLRRMAAADGPEPLIPAPEQVALDTPRNILIAGVGGTGVVTVGALLGMAAHLEGLAVSVSDFTGLSQKGGSVTSHVRIALDRSELHAARIPEGQADLLLAYDAVVAVSPPVLRRLAVGRARAVINQHIAPTSEFVHNPQANLREGAIRQTLERAVGNGASFIDATGSARKQLGDAIGANLFLLGYAYQKGDLPLSEESLRRAIELNGTAVRMNLKAFTLGRLAAANGSLPAPSDDAVPEPPLDVLLDQLSAQLTDYQNVSYARRFREALQGLRRAEALVTPRSRRLTRVAANSLFKLMAYKDEYEVARLHTSAAFRQSLSGEFEGDYRVAYSFSPPILGQLAQRAGRPRKFTFAGWWMTPALRGLAALRGLRGSPLDPFGMTQDRRVERSLISDFELDLRSVALSLNEVNLEAAAEVLGWPQKVRGYGHVKLASIPTRDERKELLTRMRGLGRPSVA